MIASCFSPILLFAKVLFLIVSMIWKLWYFPEKNDSKNNGTRLEPFLNERKGPCKKSESKSRPLTMELSVFLVRTSGTVNRNASNAGWSVSSFPFLLGGQDVFSQIEIFPNRSFNKSEFSSFWKVPTFLLLFHVLIDPLTVLFLQESSFSCKAPKTSVAFTIDQVTRWSRRGQNCHGERWEPHLKLNTAKW